VFLGGGHRSLTPLSAKTVAPGPWLLEGPCWFHSVGLNAGQGRDPKNGTLPWMRAERARQDQGRRLPFPDAEMALARRDLACHVAFLTVAVGPGIDFSVGVVGLPARFSRFRLIASPVCGVAGLAGWAATDWEHLEEEGTNTSDRVEPTRRPGRPRLMLGIRDESLVGVYFIELLTSRTPTRFPYPPRIARP